MNKRLNFDHVAVHSTFQMLAGIVYGFGVFMLIERGYTSAEAGICLSLNNVLNIIASPIISNYLDNSKKYSVFESTAFLSIFVLILFVINYFLATKSLLLSIVFVVGCGIYSSLEPQVNSYSATFQNNGINIGFSGARAAGSLSYGLVCALFGVLSVKYSYRVVVLGGILFSLLLFISAVAIRRNYYIVKPNSEVIEDYEGIGFKDFIKNNKMFMILCIFMVGLFLGYTCIDNFMILVVENVGGTSGDMGGILAFKALIEGIAIFCFPLFIKKIKLEKILVLSAIMFAAKTLAILLSPNVVCLYLSQLLQALSFAMIFPGIVEYVHINMSEKEAIRGNACLSLAIGIGSIFSSTIAGIISDTYGVSAMMIFAFIVTLVSCIGFTITMSKMTNNM